MWFTCSLITVLVINDNLKIIFQFKKHIYIDVLGSSKDSNRLLSVRI